MPIITETETVWKDGVLVDTIIHRLEITQAEANRRDLLVKAQAALTSNQTFLGLASPTPAQLATQVTRMTRQLNAIIRALVLNATEDVSDT